MIEDRGWWIVDRSYIVTGRTYSVGTRALGTLDRFGNTIVFEFLVWTV